MLILNAVGLQIRPSRLYIINANTQCGRITNPPEQVEVMTQQSGAA